jgi:hypothetical protein
MTTYAILEEMEPQKASSLPYDDYTDPNEDILIIPTYLVPVAQVDKTKLPLETCQWTNDDLGKFTAYVPEKDAQGKPTEKNVTNCNTNIGSNDSSKMYNFRCLQLQYVYQSSCDNKLFDFTIHFKYSPTPTPYIHEVTFYGRKMNLFNMYISYFLAEKLEKELINYAHSFGCIMKRNEFPGHTQPGQLIIPFTEHYSSIKLQMIIQDEYFYWAITTLMIHFSELEKVGLLRFKFSYLLGERKFNKFSELFPDAPKGTDTFETYSNDGKEYRREVLYAPTIVLYLKQRTLESGKMVDFVNIKPLIDALQELFPTNISNGNVPRFNYRIDDNLFFSIGGENAYKFDRPSVPPLEYQQMIRNPTKYEEYNKFSQYISGHDVLDGDQVNNIRSYYHLFDKETSFRDVYASVGLSHIYNNIWEKLGLARIEIQVNGGKRSKKRRTKRKRKTKKN